MFNCELQKYNVQFEELLSAIYILDSQLNWYSYSGSLKLRYKERVKEQQLRQVKLHARKKVSLGWTRRHLKLYTKPARAWHGEALWGVLVSWEASRVRQSVSQPA